MPNTDRHLSSNQMSQLPLLDARSTVYLIEVPTDDGWTPMTSTHIDWVARQVRSRLSRAYGDARITPYEVEWPGRYGRAT